MIGSGPEGQKQLIGIHIAAYPDLHHAVEKQIAEGDTTVPLFNQKEPTMNTIHSLVNRQPLKVTGSTRSPRGFLAAIVLLLAIPIALLCQMVFGIELEITFHFLLAISSVLCECL